MIYKKKQSIGGKWVKASEIQNGTRAKIMSETKPQPSQFFDKNGNAKTQDVAKVRFENLPEVVNVGLNRATINGLIDAFGEDTANWQNHYLTVITESGRVSGRAVTYLYLIPEGFEKINDANGYAVITRKGSPVIKDEDIPVVDVEEEQEEIDLKDIPF
jgi:hypothetical protein